MLIPVPSQLKGVINEKNSFMFAFFSLSRVSGSNMYQQVRMFPKEATGS